MHSAERERSSLNVDVRLHQGSALSPYLFLVLVNALTERVRKEVLVASIHDVCGRHNFYFVEVKK